MHASVSELTVYISNCALTPKRENFASFNSRGFLLGRKVRKQLYSEPNIFAEDECLFLDQHSFVYDVKTNKMALNLPIRYQNLG